MLVFNLIEPEKIPFLPPLTDASLRRRFQHVTVFRMDGFENRIVAFSAQPLDAGLLREQLLRVGRAHRGCYGVGKHYLTDVLRDGS